MKIAVLASGSKGNCTYVETKATKSLIDIGMSNLYVENNLIDLGINPDKIENIFITHTHIDHVAGLKVFLKKHHPTVFLTIKMYEELSKTISFENYVIIDGDIVIGDTIVSNFKTSHDTEDSVGYIFTNGDKSLVYVTDTGYIQDKYLNKLSNKDIYIMESNHDVKLLMDNPHYPYQTKQRILSDRGHLSNKDSAYYLSHIVGNKTKYVILAHLSEQNNTPLLAKETLLDTLGKNNQIIDHILVAEQNHKTELLEV